MTTARIDDDGLVATCITRGVLYGFLAGALAFPTDERLVARRDKAGPVLALLSTGDSVIDGMVRVAATALTGLGDELRRAHTAVFPPIDSCDHPPHESAYASGDIFVQTDVMADVAAFYRAHGLQAGGRERERPDHICTELEFMAFMANKEGYAIEALGPDEVTECRRTQAHFLRDHLGCWGPAFGRRLSHFAPEGPYRQVGELLAAWIELDVAALGVTPQRVLDQPHPPPPPDDGGCGLDAEGMGLADAASTPVTVRTPPAGAGVNQ